MELKHFVKEALLSITDGVKEANSVNDRFRIIGMKRDNSGVDGNDVEFDVSIVVEQKSSNQARAGGKVGVTLLNVLNVASADLSLQEGQTDSHQNINHLRFKVWVSESELS
ncbi:MAG: hypothetical protein WC243_00430 [Patescibacteria group bacterium]|jgi:hypothetical protein